MKKKGIATLALAGALAVSMVPAFAANDTTTVGYTAGGNVSGDGRVMVTIPMDVTFTDGKSSVTGFNVEAMVWDSVNQNWTAPNGTTNKLGKSITVSVKSDNGFKLKNGTEAAGIEGTYNYEVNKKTLDSKINAGTVTEIGTLKDAGQDAAQDPALYSLDGTVTMTNAPKLGQTEKAVFFSDVLTYSFGGLT